MTSSFTNGTRGAQQTLKLKFENTGEDARGRRRASARAMRKGGCRQAMMSMSMSMENKTEVAR